MIQCLQFRKASFLGTEEWKTIPWEFTTKDRYQKLLDKAFKLGSLLENMDSSSLKGLSEKVRDFGTYIRELAGMDMEMEQWLREYLLESPSPLYWEARPSPTPESSRTQTSIVIDAAPPSPVQTLAFADFKTANTLVTYWSLRIVLSNTIALTCAAILSKMPPSQSGAPSGVADMRAKAQFLLSRHGDAFRTELATDILRSMPYCINDDMGILGAQKSLFPLRVAMFSLRRHPGPLLRWGNDLYQQLDSKTGIRYAREIAKYGGGPFPNVGPSQGATLPFRANTAKNRGVEGQNMNPPDVDEAFLRMSKLEPSTSNASARLSPVNPN